MVLTPELMAQLRARMTPEQAAELDKRMDEAARLMVEQMVELRKVVQALDVLHRQGEGEQQGFCEECGNVFPCQTRRFIRPFTDATSL